MRIAIAALALSAASPAAADRVDRWRPYIEEASARFAIPAEWIEQVIRAESGGQTTLNGRPIVSRAGAIGLMQLMPGTWADMRTQLGLRRDPHHPRDNILAGTLYLRLMYERFGYPGLFAAYNAGPGRYAEYLAGRRSLPGETRAYLAKVGGEIAPRLVQAPLVHSRAGIFFALRDSAGKPDDERDSRAGLFVRLYRLPGEVEDAAHAKR